MQSVDFFYYVVALCAVALVGIIAWVSWHIVQTLKTVQSVAERVDDTARDFTLVKDGIKTGAFALIAKVVSGIGGGDKK